MVVEFLVEVDGAPIILPRECWGTHNPHQDMADMAVVPSQNRKLEHQCLIDDYSQNDFEKGEENERRDKK